MPCTGTISSVRRSRSRPQPSLARQLFVLQIGLVLLACVIAVTIAVWRARSDVSAEAGRRCLSITETVVGTNWVAQQFAAADPTVTLQPFATTVLDTTGVDFMTVMRPDGTRLTHPDPTQIGLKYLGTIDPAVAGGTVVETYTGTLGPSVRAVAPIRSRRGGPIIGLVAVGVRVDSLSGEIAARVGVIALIGSLLLVLALIGTALIGRRTRQQTLGLGAGELGLMHHYYDAVLHSVREGLLVLDPAHRIELINGEAQRLLALDVDPTGRPLADLGLPADLLGAMVGSDPLVDAVQLAGDRVLVVSALPARSPSHGRAASTTVGRVVTLRDHTELTDLAHELGTARDLTEALKSQSHEAANRLHAVITMVELGRTGEAIAFATEELQLAQQLTDQVVGAMPEPVIAAVLLGKAQVAAERGIDLVVSADSTLDPDALTDCGLEVREVVTVLANLIDNAMDALGRNGSGPESGQIAVTVRRTEPDADALFIRVADNGPGLDRDQARLAFGRGWTTKPQDAAPHGHGIGLGLVGQVVRRHGGTVSIDPPAGGGSGAVFTIRLGR